MHFILLGSNASISDNNGKLTCIIFIILILIICDFVMGEKWGSDGVRVYQVGTGWRRYFAEKKRCDGSTNGSNGS